MSDTNPLSYYNTAALVSELQNRFDTTILVFYRRDTGDSSTLLYRVSGAYVEATGLAQLIPQFVEDVLGEPELGPDQE